MTPENINFIDPTSYRLVVDRIPNTEFFCRGVSIPTVSVTEATANYKYSNIPMLADKLSFDSLTVSIMIDEDMKTYKEVYDWIKECTLEATNIESVMSDISVVVTNNKNNKAKTFNFNNAFPISIGSLEFNSSETAPTYLTAEITFRFSNMTLV